MIATDSLAADLVHHQPESTASAAPAIGAHQAHALQPGAARIVRVQSVQYPAALASDVRPVEPHFAVATGVRRLNVSRFVALANHLHRVVLRPVAATGFLH